MELQIKPTHPEFNIAVIEFKGNHEKQYEFFVEREQDKNSKDVEALNAKVGDTALCSTRAGLSVGRIVRIKPFSKRSSLCAAVILDHFSEGTMADYERDMLAAVKYQQEQEAINDILDF